MTTSCSQCGAVFTPDVGNVRRGHGKFCSHRCAMLHRHGSITPEQRFWSNVEIISSESCWLWTGGTNWGYGRLQIDGKPAKAHRLAFELMRGPIPDGLQIDHLCRVRRCVNPSHLEAVTAKVNAIRRTGALPRRTHCMKGHAFTGDNTIIEHGWRICKQCRNERQRAGYHRRKNAAIEAAE